MFRYNNLGYAVIHEKELLEKEIDEPGTEFSPEKAKDHYAVRIWDLPGDPTGTLNRQHSSDEISHFMHQEELEDIKRRGWKIVRHGVLYGSSTEDFERQDPIHTSVSHLKEIVIQAHEEGWRLDRLGLELDQRVRSYTEEVHIRFEMGPWDYSG